MGEENFLKEAFPPPHPPLFKNFHVGVAFLIDIVRSNNTTLKFIDIFHFYDIIKKAMLLHRQGYTITVAVAPFASLAKGENIVCSFRKFNERSGAYEHSSAPTRYL